LHLFFASAGGLRLPPVFPHPEEATERSFGGGKRAIV